MTINIETEKKIIHQHDNKYAMRSRELQVSIAINMLYRSMVVYVNKRNKLYVTTVINMIGFKLF